MSLSQILSILGGPTIPQLDLESTGEKILDGLADLLGVPDDDRDEETKLRAALRDIALEKGELDILKHVGWKPPPSDSPELPVVPEDYLPPSRLAKKAKYLQSQTSLQERQLHLLKVRLKQSKAASHALSHNIKSIYARLENTQSQIQELEDNLGELSIKADTTLSQTHRASLSLLSPSPSEDLQTLTNLTSQRANLTTALQSSLASCTTPSAEYTEQLQTEISRLNLAISSALQKAEESELHNVLKELQEGGLDALLAEFDACTSDDEDAVEEKMKVAWGLDRLRELDALESVYDHTISALSDTLLAPLKALYDNMQRQDEYIREAEAILGAFGEEMEDIPLPSSTEPDETPPTSSLQQSLQSLLNTPSSTSTLQTLFTLRPPAIPTIPHPAKPTLLNTFHSPLPPTEWEGIAREKAERLEREVKRLEGELESVFGRAAMGKGGRTARRLERWMASQK